MKSVCPECGATVPESGSCKDNFYNLLMLEGDIQGVGGSILHFHAVATYNLQHPRSMNFKTEALAGLLRTLGDVLDGKLTVENLRRRGQRATNGPTRVTRRDGDEAASWPTGPWPKTIADVCAVESYGSYDTYEEYAGRVIAWARSVRETLDSWRATSDV